MLTITEQLLFLKEERKRSIKALTLLKQQFGDRYSYIFIEKINHEIFCYDAIVASINELQSLNTKSYGKQ